MAMAMKIVLIVLTAGCVMNQSTADDSESSPNPQLQLQLQKLEQQHHQIAHVLHRLLDRQQQQLSKLSELQTILANRLGKLGDMLDADGVRNLVIRLVGYAWRKFVRVRLF